jgi:hypothetical protein
MGVKKGGRAKRSGARSTKTRASAARVEKRANVSPADAQRADAQPVDAKPVEAKPVDAKPAEARGGWGWTGTAAAGAAFVVIAAVAGVGTFAGRDSGARVEATAVAAQPDSAALQPPPAKPVRAIAGVQGRKTAPKARPEASGSPAAPKTASEVPDAAMIEGCLEQTGVTFRLKDTSGADAPKKRSWKSGFLKKGSRPVDVVDWNNRLKDHVGERVTVSGMFVDGEMHVRTLRRIAASCN